METIPLEDGKGTSPFGGVPGDMTDRHPAVIPLNAARLVTRNVGEGVDEHGSGVRLGKLFSAPPVLGPVHGRRLPHGCAMRVSPGCCGHGSSRCRWRC